MKLAIGDANTRWPGPDSEVEDADLLSESARRLLLRESALVIPWPLALLAQDLLDNEERESELRRHIPPWLSADDFDAFVLEAVSVCALPSRTPLRLKLRASGRPGESRFRMEAEWTRAEGRRMRDQPTVAGGIIRNQDSEPRRLTYGQYQLVQRLALVKAWGQGRKEDLLASERLQSAVPAGDPGVILDPFLERNPVVSVERIKPILKPVQSGYQVRPQVPGVSQSELDDYYYNENAAGLGSAPLVTKRDDGTRVRVAFTDDAAEGLKRCRQLHTITPQEAAHALSHPEEFFGDALDVSDYSDRVVGLGPNVRRVVPVLREISGGDWWDWDFDAVAEPLVEEDIEESGNAAIPEAINFKDPEVVKNLQGALEHADAQGDLFIPSPNGDGLLEINPQLRQAVDSAAELMEEETRSGKLKKRPTEVLQVAENYELLIFDRGAPPAAEPIPDLGPPPGLAQGIQLFDYQKEGYEWLVALYRQAESAGPGWHGALLADDMGLGKTIQLLSFLSWLQDHAGGGPHLLVAPVGLLDNWQREAQRFYGARLEPILQVVGRDLPGNHDVAAKRLGAQNLVMVSYETLRRYELIFARVPWNVVILDEAQKAKDPSSQVARVLRTLKAKFRVALTGTPVENTLKELWAIYDWAKPGLLGSLRSFAEDFIKPLKNEGDAVRAQLAARIHERIGPLFMRRMKSQALKDLPRLDTQVDRVRLSPEQERAYGQILSQEGAQSIGSLITLFGVTAHPRLTSNEGDLPSPTEDSFPRVERLFDILDDVHARREKAIVFANRRRLHAWLADIIGERYGVKVEVINGQVTSSKARMQKLERFSAQDGFSVIVLAPKAAGVGLNITAANHVLHYTREWNPAIENQATDRAYRMGQTRPVHVHYFVATSDRGTTVDERLNELLESKRALMSEFIVPMGGFDVVAKDLLSS